jgi:hypothetical protein
LSNPARTASQPMAKAHTDFQDLIDSAIPHMDEDDILNDVLRQNPTEFDTFAKD